MLLWHLTEDAPWIRSTANLEDCHRLLAERPHLRIDHVEVRGAADATRSKVRAIVHLGALLPCDVQVELLTDGSGQRLYSSSALANGSYVFEASIPASTLGELHAYAVRVTPSRCHSAPAGISPVVRWEPFQPTGGECPRAESVGGRST